MSNRTIIKFMLAVVCCALIVLTPASRAYAQLGGLKHGVEQGVDATKQGTEKAYDTTKQGAQDVGHGVKKAITGEDNNSTDRYKSSQQQSTTTTTPTRRSGKANEGATANEPGKSGNMARNADHNLPKTAGELPLLLVISLGCFALVGRSKLARKKS
jgi:hypothetical protein